MEVIDKNEFISRRDLREKYGIGKVYLRCPYLKTPDKVIDDYGETLIRRQIRMKNTQEKKIEYKEFLKEFEDDGNLKCPICKNFPSKRNLETGEIKTCQKCNKLQFRLKKYKITAIGYYDLLNKQSNKCAICLREFGVERSAKPVVDHCHELNHVRGIICGSCNTGLGFFQDSQDIIENAAKYLKYNLFDGGWFNKED